MVSVIFAKIIFIILHFSVVYAIIIYGLCTKITDYAKTIE